MFNKNQPQNIFLFGLIFFILDRIIKYLFVVGIFPAKAFLITYLKNYNLAFGLHLPESVLFLFWIVVGLIILFLVSLLIKSWQDKKYLELFSFWLILLGAISNIIDRLKFGFVVDYIDIHIWSVFNIADIMIVGGVVLLLLKYYRINKHEH